jgi:hypothetical protein
MICCFSLFSDLAAILSSFGEGAGFLRRGICAGGGALDLRGEKGLIPQDILFVWLSPKIGAKKAFVIR